MDELKDSVEEHEKWFTEKIHETEKETSGRGDDTEKDRFIEDQTYKGVYSEEKLINQSVSKEVLSSESTVTLPKAQKNNKTFEENQSELSSKPSLSFIALIARAILSSRSRKLNLSSIYRYIEENFPYFKSRHQGWRNSIRHNLSLNDCFVKLGHCENGKGHYWGIHPDHLADFLRGDFRQHRKANRSRQLRTFQMSEACSWTAQCYPLEYLSSSAVAGGWLQMGYLQDIAHPRNSTLFEWMNHPQSVCFTALQSFGTPEVQLCRINRIYTPYNGQF